MKFKLLRYIFGFFVLAVILAAMFFSKKILFAVSVLFIIFALKEYREMFAVKDIHIHKFIPEIISSLFVFIFLTGYYDYVMPIMLFGIFLSYTVTVILNKKPYIITTTSTISGFLFTFCALYMIKLYYLFYPDNTIFTAVYIFAVMAGDFSASKIGPKFGKKALSPEISPNKTVAGAVSNLIFTILVSMLLIPVLKLNILQCIFFGTCVSFAAQIGDLSVSTVKRDLGIKHSGNLFLNYGGILDRVDAFMFSAPAAYYAIIFITSPDKFL